MSEEPCLGRFQLVRQLGQGGMGEVWLARDPRLGRKVAIKILPPGKATASAKQRFQREIRALAACNHSVIARIYEAGEAVWPAEPEKKVSFIVMELVSGVTLKERISRGPLPPAEAVGLLCRALEGLAAAHDNHLVHRDIKPSNLMITGSGEVKLLDLGLARMAQTELSMDETGPVRLSGDDPGPEVTLTRYGDLVGTPAYMSPEQVLGKPVDARTDCWAVGLLLFEMLTGRRAINARSSAAALFEIPKLKLDPKLLPPRTPPRLVQILNRCLSQDSRRRYHHARDLLYDLELVQNDQQRLPAISARVLSLALGSLLVVTLAVLIAVLPRPVTQPVQGALDLGFDGLSPVLTPDGTRVLYLSGDQHEIRAASTAATGRHQQLLSSEQAVNHLTLGLDGTWVFFDRRDQDGSLGIFRMPASGGAPRLVSKGWAPAVSHSGQLIACFDWVNPAQVGLRTCRLDGGDRRLVTVLDGPLTPLSSAFTANDRQLLVSRTEFYHESEVLRIDLETGRMETLVTVHGGATPGLALLPEHQAVVWGTELHLDNWLQSLAVSRLDSGTTTPLSMGLNRIEQPSLSADGKLILMRMVEAQDFQLAEMSVDPAARAPARRLELLAPGKHPRVSPAGDAIAYISKLWELWIYHRSEGSSRHISSLESCSNPAWSPDGHSLVYTSLRDGNSDIWLTPLDSGSSSNLTQHPANDFHPYWHPDGVHLFWVSDRDGAECIYCMNTATGTTHRVNDEASGNPAISPDGRLIAFEVGGTGSRSLRLHRLDDRLRLGSLLYRHDSKVELWTGCRPRFSPDGVWLGFQGQVEAGGRDILVVPTSDPKGSPPIRLTQFPLMTFKVHWWDWIDTNRLVVSYFPVRARLVLLRDADRWLDRALVGSPPAGE